MASIDLLAHPVRLRVVHALRGGRVRTVAELGRTLPDVSRATLYRHVEQLHEGGVLEVADERRVRGATERAYRLRPDRAGVDPGSMRAMTADDHWQAFAASMAALIAEFGAYLDRDGAVPAADLVGYRQHALWLSPAEMVDLIADLQRAIVPRLTQEPAPGRARYLLSPILFPAADAE